MNNETKELLPTWYKNDVAHDLVLSNDIDSLASCAILKKVKGWDIKYFYDFMNVYKVKGHSDENEKCWVDVAIKNGHAFDNHVSKLSLTDRWNKDMINLNTVYWITNGNYYDKYAGSTLLEVWSLYDLPLPTTEKGKMLLLAIDVAYKGFYDNNFYDIQKKYLCEDLEFEELYEVIKRHKREEFYNVIAEYGLNADIVCKNGKLTTRLRLDEISKLLELDIELPTDTFTCNEILEIKEKKIMPCYKWTEDVDTDIKTLAVTYKNCIRYSKVWDF